MNIHCFAEAKECYQALAERLVEICQTGLSRNGYFSLVLAGGSTPEPFYRILASDTLGKRLDWSRAQIFFGDERCVPRDHPDSNYRMVKSSLLDFVNIPTSQIHAIDCEGSPQHEAIRYQGIIEEILQGTGATVPGFDVVLLGLGGDGHTASLFPKSEALSSKALVAAVDPPVRMEPRVTRISLTLSGLALSHNTFFLVRGKTKENIVQQVLCDQQGIYPAAQVCRNPVSWYLADMDCRKFNG